MRTLWLVGMMGAGKSTVAPLVAARLGRIAIDIDRRVEESTGATVADLIARDESAFRRAEAEAVRAIAGSDVVASCGGGVVLDDGLVADMRSTGVVVWLDAPVEVLASRGIEDRPLLAGDAGALRRLSRARDARYRAAAHAVVDADDTPDAVADRVVEAWSTSS